MIIWFLIVLSSLWYICAEKLVVGCEEKVAQYHWKELISAPTKKKQLSPILLLQHSCVTLTWATVQGWSPWATAESGRKEKEDEKVSGALAWEILLPWCAHGSRVEWEELFLLFGGFLSFGFLRGFCMILAESYLPLQILSSFPFCCYMEWTCSDNLFKWIPCYVFFLVHQRL